MVGWSHENVHIGQTGDAMALAERVETFEIAPKMHRLLKWLFDTENSSAEREWRTEALEDYRFYAGKQDEAWVLAELENQKRPASVYNEIKPKIDMLIGLAAQAKYATELTPVGGEDEVLAEIMNGTLVHYRRSLKLSRKELECFEHSTKAGRSLLYYWINKDNPFKAKIMAKRIRGYNFFLDPQAQEYDMSDARFLFIEKWLTEEELRATMPNVDIHHLSQFGATYGDYPSFFNEARDLYRLVEGWYYEYEPRIFFHNPFSGEVEDLTESEFEKFKVACAQGLPGPDGRTVQVDPEKIVWQKGVKKVPWYTIFSGTEVFKEGKSELSWEMWPAILYGAYKNEDTNTWFSAATMMKDPQRSINTMRRQLSHLLQTLPKGILAHEVGAIINIEEYERRSADPTFHLEIGKGMIDKYKFHPQPQISPIYMEFNNMASQSMKDAGGIQDAMMGIQQSSREAGITERQRRETGYAVIYLLFANFMESRHNGTRLLMSLIQQYVTMPEIIRIEGEQGAANVEINTQMSRGQPGFNDITAMQFDLAVQDSSDNPTMRLAIAEILTDLNHNNPGSIPPDVILEYTDMPYSVKMRVRKNYEAQQVAAQKQAEIEQNMKGMELQLKQMEIVLKGKEIELKEKELETKKLDVILKNRDKPEPTSTQPKPKKKEKKS